MMWYNARANINFIINNTILDVKPIKLPDSIYFTLIIIVQGIGNF